MRRNIAVGLIVVVLVLAVLVVLGAGVAWADGPAPPPPKSSNPLLDVVGNVSTVGLAVLTSVLVGVIVTLVKLLSWVGR